MVRIGVYIDPQKENYDDTVYMQCPADDYPVVVIGGQTVPVKIAPYGEKN